MTLNIPYEIGEEVILDGKKETIYGIHIFIKQDSSVGGYRLHIGNGKFITVEKNAEENKRLKKEVEKQG